MADEIEKQIREALAKATPGPWRVSSGDVVADDADRVVFCTEDIESPDADLTVLLRNHAETLLTALSAAESRAARAEARVAELEAALRPFAEITPDELLLDGETFVVVWSASPEWAGADMRLVNAWDGVTAGDLRRAKAALAKDGAA